MSSPPGNNLRNEFVSPALAFYRATDKMDLEQTIKWGEEKIKAIYANFA